MRTLVRTIAYLFVRICCSFFFLVIEIAYIILSLVFYQQQVNNSITRFEIYNVTHLYFANTQHIIEGIFNMFAIDKGSYYNYESLDYQTAEFFFQQYLEQETIYQFALDEILTKIYLNNVGVTQQMQDLFINNRNIKLLIHFNNIQTTIYPNNLYQVSQQVLAKVYHFKRVPLGKFDYHNNDIFINLANFSNQLFNQIIEYRDYQEEKISKYLNSVQNYILSMVQVGLIFILAYLIFAFFLYLKTLFYYQEISTILTTIPFSQVRNQVKRYEKFLNSSTEEQEQNESVEKNDDADDQDEKENQDQNVNIGHQDDNQYNNQNYQLQESKSPKSDYYQNQDGLKMSKKKQNNQNQNNSSDNIAFNLRGITSQNIRPVKYSLFNIQILMPFFFQIIFLIVFIIVETQLTKNFTSLLQNSYQELTYSLKLEPNFMLLLSCLKSQTIANNFVGVRQLYEPIAYFKDNINYLYDLMENLTDIHYNNYINLPMSYQSQFDQYFSQNQNICSELYKKNHLNINQTECNTILNGTFNEGMNINIQHLITQMIAYSQTITKSEIKLLYKQSMNSQMYEIQIICTYLKFTIRELNNLFITGIQSLSDNLKIARLATGITIYSLLFSIFLFVSMPIIQQIKSQIFSQRQIFCLIPQNVISQNSHIRFFILKQYQSCKRN